jgi:hypothetical protein
MPSKTVYSYHVIPRKTARIADIIANRVSNKMASGSREAAGKGRAKIILLGILYTL